MFVYNKHILDICASIEMPNGNQFVHKEVANLAGEDNHYYESLCGRRIRYESVWLTRPMSEIFTACEIYASIWIQPCMRLRHIHDQCLHAGEQFICILNFRFDIIIYTYTFYV